MTMARPPARAAAVRAGSTTGGCMCWAGTRTLPGSSTRPSGTLTSPRGAGASSPTVVFFTNHPRDSERGVLVGGAVEAIERFDGGLSRIQSELQKRKIVKSDVMCDIMHAVRAYL